MNSVNNKKNYSITAIVSLMGVGIGIILGVISAPISLNYWHADGYGIFAVISSIVAYISFTNLGIPQAASVLIGKATDDNVKKTILIKAFIIMSASVVVVILNFIIINIYSKNWIGFIGKIPVNLLDDTYQACYILIISSLISLPFSLSSAICFGFNRQYLENISQILFQLLIFAVSMSVIFFDGSLVDYAIFVGAFSVLFNVTKLALLYYFVMHQSLRRNFRDSAPPFDEAKYSEIVKTGIRFLGMSLAAVVTINIDNLLLSNMLGMEYVTQYSLTVKLFAILYALIGALNVSLLPIISKEFRNDNWSWINGKFNIFLNINVLFGGSCFILSIFFFKDIILLWVGSAGYAGLWTVVFLGFYVYILGVNSITSGTINTLNYVKDIYWIFWGEAIIRFVVSSYLIAQVGISGMAIGTFVGGLIPSVLLLSVLKKRSGNRISYDIVFLLRHFLLLTLPLVMFALAVQMYVDSFLVNLLLGTISCLVYCVVSFLILPQDTNYFVVDNFNKLRLKIKSLFKFAI
jgi:O-antigen/teichoic acid export membrane protein